MTPQMLPISVVIATRDRSGLLQQTFQSLARQGAQPDEIVVVDASKDAKSEEICREWASAGRSAITWTRADILGAAAQRNQGVDLCRHSVVGFFDDDILFEPDCISRLWTALVSTDERGGVSAMILNQRYHPPGLASRLMFYLMAGRRERSYAGKVLGPAVNLLPEDHDTLPDVVIVEWLNTTCTLYRRAALPDPPFESHFTGYSMMEDLALSLKVGRRWQLANARTARIVHNSQPTGFKEDARSMARMELVNRYHIITTILGKKDYTNLARLALWEGFALLSALKSTQSRRNFPEALRGKWDAVADLWSSRASKPKQP